MFEIDANGVFHDVHAPRPELLLVPPEAIVGRRQDELLPPEALAVAQAALQEALSQGQAHGYCYRLRLERTARQALELGYQAFAFPSV